MPASITSEVRTLHWVIVGGESGAGARPMHPGWVRSIRDQCLAAEVPFFFKQWGEWAPLSLAEVPLAALPRTMPSTRHLAGGIEMTNLGKKLAGRMLDNLLHDGMPI